MVIMIYWVVYLTPLSGQIKDYKIVICCFSAKNMVLRTKSKDWLTWKRDNVSNEHSDACNRNCLTMNIVTHVIETAFTKTIYRYVISTFTNENWHILHINNVVHFQIDKSIEIQNCVFSMGVDHRYYFKLKIPLNCMDYYTSTIWNLQKVKHRDKTE